MTTALKKAVERILCDISDVASHFGGKPFHGTLSMDTNVVTPEPDLMLWALIIQTTIQKEISGQDLVATSVHAINNRFVFVFEGDFFCIALEIPETHIIC